MQAEDPSGAGDARLRRCHRPRSARHPARAQGRVRIGNFRPDGGPAPRGADARLPRSPRASDALEHPDPSFLDRLARVARRLRRPDRQILVYHNITPPEFFIDVHEQLAEQCFKGRRELSIYPARVRSRARRFGVQSSGARGAGVQPDRGAAGRSRLLPSRSAAERSDRGGVRRRLDQYPVRRPGHPEQAHRGRHPLLPRLSAPLQSAVAAAVCRVVRRLREVSRDAAGARGRAGT